MARYVKNEVNYHGAKSKVQSTSREANSQGLYQKASSSSCDAGAYNDNWDDGLECGMESGDGWGQVKVKNPTQSKRNQTRENKKYHSRTIYASGTQGSSWNDVADDFPSLGGGGEDEAPNVWEQRRAALEETRVLAPETETEEEQMLRKAIELSRVEASRSVERRRDLEEEYNLQMHILQANPELFKEFRIANDLVCNESSSKKQVVDISGWRSSEKWKQPAKQESSKTQKPSTPPEEDEGWSVVASKTKRYPPKVISKSPTFDDDKTEKKRQSSKKAQDSHDGWDDVWPEKKEFPKSKPSTTKPEEDDGWSVAVHKTKPPPPREDTAIIHKSPALTWDDGDVKKETKRPSPKKAQDSQDGWGDVWPAKHESPKPKTSTNNPEKDDGWSVVVPKTKSPLSKGDTASIPKSPALAWDDGKIEKKSQSSKNTQDDGWDDGWSTDQASSKSQISETKSRKDEGWSTAAPKTRQPLSRGESNNVRKSPSITRDNGETEKRKSYSKKSFDSNGNWNVSSAKQESSKLPFFPTETKTVQKSDYSLSKSRGGSVPKVSARTWDDGYNETEKHRSYYGKACTNTAKPKSIESDYGSWDDVGEKNNTSSNTNKHNSTSGFNHKAQSSKTDNHASEDYDVWDDAKDSFDNEPKATSETDATKKIKKVVQMFGGWGIKESRSDKTATRHDSFAPESFDGEDLDEMNYSTPTDQDLNSENTKSSESLPGSVEERREHEDPFADSSDIFQPASSTVNSDSSDTQRSVLSSDKEPIHEVVADYNTLVSKCGLDTPVNAIQLLDEEPFPVQQTDQPTPKQLIIESASEQTSENDYSILQAPQRITVHQDNIPAPLESSYSSLFSPNLKMELNNGAAHEQMPSSMGIDAPKSLAQVEAQKTSQTTDFLSNINFPTAAPVIPQPMEMHPPLQPGLMNLGAINPAMMDPRMMDLTMMNPKMMDPAMMDPRMMEPTMMDPRMMDPAMMNPRMMDPTMMNPLMMQQMLMLSNPYFVKQLQVMHMYQTVMMPANPMFPSANMLRAPMMFPQQCIPPSAEFQDPASRFDPGNMSPMFQQNVHPSSLQGLEPRSDGSMFPQPVPAPGLQAMEPRSDLGNLMQQQQQLMSGYPSFPQSAQPEAGLCLQPARFDFPSANSGFHEQYIPPPTLPTAASASSGLPSDHNSSLVNSLPNSLKPEEVNQGTTTLTERMGSPGKKSMRSRSEVQKRQATRQPATQPTFCRPPKID